MSLSSSHLQKQKLIRPKRIMKLGIRECNHNSVINMEVINHCCCTNSFNCQSSFSLYLLIIRPISLCMYCQNQQCSYYFWSWMQEILYLTTAKCQ